MLKKILILFASLVLVLLLAITGFVFYVTRKQDTAVREQAVTKASIVKFKEMKTRVSIELADGLKKNQKPNQVLNLYIVFYGNNGIFGVNLAGSNPVRALISLTNQDLSKPLDLVLQDYVKEEQLHGILDASYRVHYLAVLCPGVSSPQACEVETPGAISGEQIADLVTNDKVHLPMALMYQPVITPTVGDPIMSGMIAKEALPELKKIISHLSTKTRYMNYVIKAFRPKYITYFEPKVSKEEEGWFEIPYDKLPIGWIELDLETGTFKMPRSRTINPSYRGPVNFRLTICESSGGASVKFECNSPWDKKEGRPAQWVMVPSSNRFANVGEQNITFNLQPLY